MYHPQRRAPLTGEAVLTIFQVPSPYSIGIFHALLIRRGVRQCVLCRAHHIDGGRNMVTIFVT